MKYYKGFDKDMKCRGFQFEEGQTYREEKAELCSSGFHACEMPIDVLQYYAPGKGSIYREVELDEISEERNSDNSKVCTKIIKIGAKRSIDELVKAQIEYVRRKCSPTTEESATGDYGAASATGYQGAASATGYQGAASATGNACVAISSGINGRVMGTFGNAIFGVERGDFDGTTHPIISVASAIVDGKRIRENVWYIVKNGEFVEADE